MKNSIYGCNTLILKKCKLIYRALTMIYIELIVCRPYSMMQIFSTAWVDIYKACVSQRYV